jgi:hypothetical protein
VDCGDPISYLVLEPGTPVYAADESQIGTVVKALYVEAEDVFDGIVISTAGGERFVDAPDCAGIFQRCVHTTLTPEQAKALQPPAAAPPVYKTDPGEGSGGSFGAWWNRVFRKGRWTPKT